MNNNVVATAQFEAKVALAYYRFLKAHVSDAEGSIAPCDANRKILESYCDSNLLPCDDPSSWEIALLGCGSQLARTKVRVAPVAPPVAPPPPAALSEEEELRKILRENKGNPRAAANAVRARLKVADVRSKSAQTTIPAKYTAEILRKMSGTELRKIQQRYGFDSINARLQGRN